MCYLDSGNILSRVRKIKLLSNLFFLVHLNVLLGYLERKYFFQGAQNKTAIKPFPCYVFFLISR